MRPGWRRTATWALVAGAATLAAALGNEHVARDLVPLMLGALAALVIDKNLEGDK